MKALVLIANCIRLHFGSYVDILKENRSWGAKLVIVLVLILHAITMTFLYASILFSVLALKIRAWVKGREFKLEEFAGHESKEMKELLSHMGFPLPRPPTQLETQAAQ